ncbi:glycosyltransferase 87 family protein [Streptomyces kunmingensis]|uniref:Glycosyltransferase 87 family protein n=1 Tax=Streptomyces kunmingensis TaxID=68225 RepID=A0ABU6CK41_9ACTN|nr:glycosyltransferase 87 family protein [Streptomyces kunmingensis]MEB3964472.1 glycosyltransferase 87 family protein [Streptomyces kunmingensis]
MTVLVLPRTRRRVPAALGVCLLSFVSFWIAQRAAHVSMIDLMVYRAEGATVRAGSDLYALRTTHARLPTTYPPFAALLFTPLTLLDVATMQAAATVTNLALLVAFVYLSLRLVGRHARVEHALWVAAGAVWCEPVWTTLRYGQVNLLLAVLVLWDLTRRPGHRWAGVGIGAAAAIKLTPALFVVFLLCTGITLAATGRGSWRPWVRHACVAGCAFTAATALAAVVLPHDSRRFWTRMVFEASRVGHAEDTANQSLRGVLARLLHTGDPSPWWVPAAAVTGAVGLTVAVVAAVRGRRAEAVVACATTALLVSPVSWSHHWVWCVPLVLLVWESGRRRTAALMAVPFCSYTLWWVPHGRSRPELQQSGEQLLLTALYVGVACAFLAYCGVRLWRTSRTA